MRSRKYPGFSVSLHLSSQLHQLSLQDRSAQDGVEKRVDRLFDVSFQLSRPAPWASYIPEPLQSSEGWSSPADDELEPFGLILIIMELGIEVDDA